MKNRRSFALGALAVAVVLPLAACGDDEPDSGSTTPAGTEASVATSTPDGTQAPTTSRATTSTSSTTLPADLSSQLTGRTFLSSAVEGYTLVDGTRITLTFDGTNIAAQGGCNSIGSTWSLEGDVLVVPEVRSTMMACEPAALMDQDTWLSAVLTSRPTVTLDGDTLTISADGSTVTLVDREVAEPDRSLDGTTWTLETIVSADAASSVPTGVRPATLVFDGTNVAVDTGCNTGRASYTMTADDITFGPVALTRMACVDPAGSAVEQAVLTVLTGTATVDIEAGVLTMTNGTDGLVLRAPADASGTTTTTGPAVADGLIGPTWALSAITSGGTTTPRPGGVRAPTLTFDATSVAVFDGCNTGSGAYATAGDQITFGPRATTMMACIGETATVSDAIAAVLTGTATFAIGAEGALTLTNGDQGLTYTSG